MNIPIIDFSSYRDHSFDTKETARLIRQTCKNTGFFYIKNHGVPEELQKSIVNNAEKFFSLSRKEKRKIQMALGKKAWRGYFEVGEQYTSGKIDLKQGLYLGQQLDKNHPKVLSQTPLHGQNLYPEQIPGLKQDILLWLKQMDRLGNLLMQAISESLELERNYFSKSICREHLGLLRIFHYPYDPDADPSLWAVGEHSDYGLLTILMISDKGLQAKSVNNQWINIDPIPNTFVINIGDILEKMTRGLYKSTPHRAKNTEGKSRYAVPYFYDPGWDEEIKELDIKVDEDELKVLQNTHAFERWDKVKLKTISGTYGDYILGKVSKVFPMLAKSELQVI